MMKSNYFSLPLALLFLFLFCSSSFATYIIAGDYEIEQNCPCARKRIQGPPSPGTSQGPPPTPSSSQGAPPSPRSSQGSPPTPSTSQSPPTPGTIQGAPPSPGTRQGSPPTPSTSQSPPTPGTIQGVPPSPGTSQGSPPTPSTSQSPPTPSTSQGAPPSPGSQGPPSPGTSQATPPSPGKSQGPPTPNTSQGSPPTPRTSQGSPPTPGSSQGAPPTPGTSRGAPPTPGTSRGAPPTPGSSQGAPPTPGTSQGAPPTPGSIQGAPPTPGSIQGAPPTPGTIQGAPPTPGSSQGAPPTPGTSQGTPPTPGTIQGAPPTPGSSQGAPPTPSTSQGAPPIPGMSQGSPPGNSNNNGGTFNGNFKGYFSKIFAFGDSYTDTGNAQFMGSLSSAFSKAFSYHFDSSSAGGSEYRLCNGRLVIDYLCDSLSLPSPPPYKATSANFSHGANFAIAGSTAFTGDFFSQNKLPHMFMCKDTPMNVQTQVDWYKQFKQDFICKGKDAASCSAEMENALFWIGEMGSTDYTRSFGSSLSYGWLSDTSVNQVTTLLRTLMDNGAKHVVVQGLPPVGCLPVAISLCPFNFRDKMGCATAVNSAIKIHNQMLQRKLQMFQKQYSDRTIIYADYYNAYQTIINNPTKYQFKKTFEVCCGVKGQENNFNMQSLCGAPGTSPCQNATEYMNWDGVHFTESMNGHLADLFFNKGYCQPSFDTLIKNKKPI